MLNTGGHKDSYSSRGYRKAREQDFVPQWHKDDTFLLVLFWALESEGRKKRMIWGGGLRWKVT